MVVKGLAHRKAIIHLNCYDFLAEDLIPPRKKVLLNPGESRSKRYFLTSNIFVSQKAGYSGVQCEPCMTGHIARHSLYVIANKPRTVKND